jgi:hypothetical protein
VASECPNGHMMVDGLDSCAECSPAIVEPTSASPSPPAGWYADPQIPNLQRFWDGATWTTATVASASELNVPTPLQSPTTTASSESTAAQSPAFIPTATRATATALPQTSTLAVVALVLAFLLWPAGLILGYVARKEIDNSQGQKTGRGLATASIILGWIALIGTVIGVGLVIAAGRGIVQSTSSTTTTPVTVASVPAVQEPANP